VFIKKAFLTRKSMYILYKKEITLLSIDLEVSRVKYILQEFHDVFLEDISSELLPLREFEHHINLILGVVLSNKPTYKSNLQESKEIQKLVVELMNKGWVEESLCPWVSVILVLEKDES